MASTAHAGLGLDSALTISIGEFGLGQAVILVSCLPGSPVAAVQLRQHVSNHLQVKSKEKSPIVTDMLFDVQLRDAN